MSDAPRPLRGSAGYTLVEMMIAVAIAVIVGAGIYAVYNSQRRVGLSQQGSLDLQTSCSFVMDQMKQELLLAGYRSSETAEKTFGAVHHKTGDATSKLFDEIDFEYFDVKAKFRDVAATDPRYDPNVAFDAGSYNEHTKVRFVHTDGVKLLPGVAAAPPAGRIYRLTWRWHPDGPAPAGHYQIESRPPQLLAENVPNLDLQLFGEDNRQMLDGAVNLDKIREIRLALTCLAPKKDPLTGRTPSIVLTAAVQPRNVGLETNPKDATPPAVPQNLKAWDPGLCGSLQLRWDANADADLAGYTIYYGLAAGSYANRVRFARGPKASGYEYYTLGGLTATKAADATPSTYHIVVTSYDKSGNQSTYSPEISGNPGTVADPNDDTRSEAELATKGNDTTLNPYPPPAPTGFAAAPPAGWETDPPDPASYYKLNLSWAKSPATGLKGYRLYRGESAGFVPSGTTEGSGNCIADENRLGPDAETVTYLDSGLVGCRTYFYKVAAISCDATIPPASMNFAAASAVPVDRTPPSAPRLAAKPGFKRVILSLENPVTAGVGAEPDFTHTKVWYNASSEPGTHYPVMDAAGNVTGGTPLPNALPYDAATPGIFALPGTLPTINFYSTATGDPATVDPQLPIGTPPDYITYYFLAVAYDRCGNHSPNVAQAQATQCGDCTEGLCVGAPPAPAGIQASGCDGSLTLTWDAIDPVVHRDLAGFRITRREGSTWAAGNPATDTELSGADPLWFTTIRDQSLEPGKRYSYRISATDCAYESQNLLANRSDSYLPNTAAGDPGLAIGTVHRIVTEPVLTGDLAAANPTFQHNLAAIRLRNTADGVYTLAGLTARWENPDAYFQHLLVGDGNETPVTTAFQDLAEPRTQGGGGSTQTIPLVATPQLAALDDRIPLVATFQNQDATVTRATTMRQDRLELGLTLTNTTTKTAGCTVSDSIFLPLGPVVGAVTMDRPTAGTPAWAVPGEAGQNQIIQAPPIVVPGDAPVTVFADVQGASAPLRKVWLYYFIDTAKYFTLAPPPLTGTYDDAAGGFNYTAIELAPVAGSLWRTPAGAGIPASNDTNVWFFVLAVDNDGNFDREPEADSGAFVYYQQTDPAVCSSVPNPPAVTGSSTSTQVTLQITAPAVNTDGSPFTDRKGFEVWRKVGAGAFTRVASVPTTAATQTWTDTPPGIGDAGNDYSYYVTAVDTCSPARVSAPSRTYTECQGASPCVVGLSPAGSIYAGGRFAVDLLVCTRQNGVPDEVLYVQDCAAGAGDYHPVELKEAGDSGEFQINAGTYGSSEVRTSLSGGGTTDLDLQVLATDTISVHGFATAPGGGWGSGCDTSLACSATLAVVPDPCLGPVTPDAPQNLTVQGSSCTANSPTVTITWSAPATGAPSFYRVYFCNGAGCDPTELLADNVTGTSYTDVPGGKLNSTSFQLWYTVKAVNAACPTNVLTGPAAPKQSDGCGSN